MNRIMKVVLVVALQLLVLQFVAACSALPALAPATAIPTITAEPTVGATSIPPTNALKPTQAPPAASPTPKVAGVRIVVQTADNTVRVYGLDGGSMVLTKAPAKLDPLNFTVATNAISDTIYASSAIGNPSPVVSVDSAGVHAVAALKTPLTGEVVGGGKMAWGALVVTGTVTTAQLFVGAPDGSQAKSIVKSTSNTSQVPKVWRPVQFSKDGSRLYYGLEPSGLGGYILFGGASNLTSYSLSDGKSTELIKDKQLGSLCIDSVSSNDKLVVYHCGDKQIGDMT